MDGDVGVVWEEFLFLVGALLFYRHSFLCAVSIHADLIQS